MITNFKIFESLSLANSYKEKLEERGFDFYTIKRLDFTPTLKYLPMICKYVLDEVPLDDIKKYIKAFDILTTKNQIINKDIYFYKDFMDLKDTVDVANIKTKGELIGDIRKEREIILNNEDFLIFIPLTHRASVKYGMGAKWCISMKNDAFMWHALTNANILFYFVIIKNKTISDKLFNRFRNDLEESFLGAQGDKNDKDNFRKIVIMTWGKCKKSKQIWTKSNHLLKPNNNKNFFKILGLDESFFKNEQECKEILISDLDESYKDQGFEIEEIDIKEIFRNAPPLKKPGRSSRVLNIPNYNYVMGELIKLKGKYVSFCSRMEKDFLIKTRIHNGVVDSVGYDNEGGNQIAYIKLVGEINYISIYPEEKIKINLTRTDIEKYNL